MDGQLAAVLVICLIAEQIEKLRVDHGDQEVKGAVRIAHDEKQRRFPVAQLVQFQFIVHGGIPNFLNVEGRKPGTAGNKDGLGRFAGSQLIKFVLPHCKGFWFFLAQILKQQVYRILIRFIVLGHLHGVEHFQQSSEVLLFNRGFIVEVCDQRNEQKSFRFVPEWVATLTFTLGVGHQCSHEFQHILFTMDVRHRVIAHTLGKVDRVEEF